MGGNANLSIQFTELDRYVGEPVWDRKMERWRVLIGYRRYNNSREVIFTDSKGMEGWEDVELVTAKEVQEPKVSKAVEELVKCGGSQYVKPPNW